MGQASGGQDPTRRRTVTWGAILVVASGVLAFVPGTDVLSFYFCLVVSPLLAVACGGVAVTAVSAAQPAGKTLAQAWSRALRACAFLTLIPLVVITLNGLRVPPCDLTYGSCFYALGPALSALCGGITGAALASLVPWRRWAHATFLATVVGTFVFNLYDLYHEPAVFFFNPFLGLYPGAIYDERIEIGSAYLGFRAFCIAVLGVLVALVSVLRGRDFRWRLARFAWPYALLGTCAGVASVLWVHAGDIGFRVTRADVEEVLSAEFSDAGCVVRYDPALDLDQARRILGDCGFRHRQMAAFFDLLPGDPIRLYVYRDEDQKARLMGARHTEVSKPWLGEVHMAAFLPGDPVLGHEVAHVVAGRLAKTFLAVPLRWGVAPDMPVIEGLAVAAAFASDGPSPHEWSLAMIRAGLPADPAALWRTDAFWLAQAGRAYTLAGSFVRFLADRYGPGTLRDLAAGRSPEEASGQALDLLVRQWRDDLEEVAGPTVDADLVRRASGRFEGPGVLGRRCPVDVARLLAEATAATRAGDAECAVRRTLEALRLAPDDRALAREALVVRAWAGDEDAVHRTLADLDLGHESRRAVADLVAFADAMAFLALRRGDVPGPVVQAALDRAQDLSDSGPTGRAIAARRAALGLPPAVALAVFDILGGGVEHPAWTLLETLAVAPDDGLIHYLLGRALVGEGEYAAAVRHLRLALAFRLPSLAFDVEVHRTLGEAAFWLDLHPLARRHLLAALEGARHEGEKMRIEEFLERMRERSLSNGGHGVTHARDSRGFSVRTGTLMVGIEAI